MSGQIDDGLATLAKSFEGAMRLGLFSFALIALNNATIGYCRWFRAKEALARLHLLDDVPPSPSKMITAGHIEGMAAYQVGDLERSAADWEREMTVSHAMGYPRAWLRSRNGLAECWFGMGRDEEARAMRPELDELDGLDDHFWVSKGVIRQALAAGDVESLKQFAPIIFDAEPTMDANERSNVGSWCAWAFIAMGDLESAERAAKIGLGDGVPLAEPNRASLQAITALVGGDLRTAIQNLRAGREFLDRAGCHLDACPLRRKLAELLLQVDDLDGTVAELQTVFEVASRLGMVVERRLAAAELEKLGVAVAKETPAPAAAPGPTGERYVTVLFMDVRGYTSLARVASPAEVADSVATLQRWAATEVEKHHGIVDKFAGDAVMATFNSSGAHVDHAQHALACAMAIRDKAGMLGLPMGAGIATGPAVVGALKDGANVSVIGEATNLASRLQAQAGSGEIVLSMESHRRVADWLSSRGHAAESDRLDLKGFPQPVEAWRLREGGGDSAAATRGETE